MFLIFHDEKENEFIINMNKVAKIEDKKYYSTIHMSNGTRYYVQETFEKIKEMLS